MSILRTVSRCSPYTRAASRALIPSTKQALRTRRYISTLYIQSTFNQVLSFLIEGDRRYSFQTPHLSARPPRWYIISPPFTVLRGFVGRTVHTPIPHLPSNGLGGKWVARLATLDAEVSHDAADRNGGGRVRKAATQIRRKPTPLQTARWKAVHKAKRKGLFIRGIARELGIHRDTVKKYMNAESPPVARPRLTSKRA